ncbi:afadin- and alpha-actinin-binding protein-like isoform X2 [Hemicordylus capensis]|nr:afadin- and alpha-actinin-binding protein-like isoform X2 [Hemicordylus capensis]XP_053154576.1 afadin- and alpha-actinin-binding protein-like isoform X2 [Hemicordylus capensis]
MESFTVPATPGEEPFMEVQCFLADYVSELGQSSAAGCGPAHFFDSLELVGRFSDQANDFCWSDNVDRCISYLNKELVELGLPSLYKDSGSGDDAEHGVDLLALTNGTCRLLNLYQGMSAKLGDMEAEEMRRAGELDYLRTRQGKLKDQVEACEREIAVVQSKEKELQSKNKQLNNTLKEEKDEITRLLSALSSQKSQHLHELKRKEQELMRLKEKMSQLLNDKKDKRGTIGYLNPLPRADCKRATGKTGKSLGKREEELYRTQLAKQDQREQGLVQENTKLKQLMNQVSQDVQQLLGMDVGIAQGMEQSSPYEVFQKQWCSLRNSMKTIGGQAVDFSRSGMLGGDGQDPVISVTDHEKEIVKLKEEIEESRVLIALQQQCFQEQLSAVTSSELPAHLKGSYFLEEEQQLQEEQEMFKEQKRAFEAERKNFTEAAIRLGRERKQFEEEKALFLKQEFLCSLPKLEIGDPKRRLSVPVAMRATEREHQSKLRWTKPNCTPYPKVIITPCHTPVGFFKRPQPAFIPSSPAILCRQQMLLSDSWPASPPQLRQSKESRQDTACQTEMPAKDYLQGNLWDHLLDSSF